MSRIRAALESLDESLSRLHEGMAVKGARASRREQELLHELQNNIETSQNQQRLMSEINDRLESTIDQLETILTDEDEDAAA